MRPLWRSSVRASSNPSRVVSARTMSLSVNRGWTAWATGRGGSWTWDSGGSRSSSAWYTSTPASRRRRIRRTSSREMWRHDSRIRPHFGHFTIHSSRFSLPTHNPPRRVGRRPRQVLGAQHSPGYLNIARPRNFLALPRREFAGHLDREAEVVSGDLLDVHAERHGRPRLRRGGGEVGPQGARDLEGRLARRHVLGREERLLGPRRNGGPQPHEELEVRVVGDGREAQQDRRGLQALGRASPPVRPEDRRHGLCLEENLGREEVAPRARFVDEAVHLVVPLRDRDVPEGDVVPAAGRTAKDLVRFDDSWTRIAHPAAVPSDEHEVSEAVPLERLANPPAERGRRRHVGDDLVRDCVGGLVTARDRREVARIHVAIERLARGVLIQDLRDGDRVEGPERDDRLPQSIDEGMDRLLARPPPGRDDLQHDRDGCEALAERTLHARPHGGLGLLEHSLNEEKHNVSRATVCDEATGWASGSGDAPSRSPCMTSS